jgi:hypothetical protein
MRCLCVWGSKRGGKGSRAFGIRDRCYVRYWQSLLYLPFPCKLQMATIFSITEQNVSAGLLILILIGFTTRRVYSVYFGPLSKFLGPKLAAATLWYEFYYDVILKGQYTFKIKELH